MEINRINFYLGNLIYNNCNLDNKNFQNINDLNINDMYSNELINLLIKTNNKNKKFILKKGDNNKNICKEKLCKNRLNNNGVILRCMRFERHWFYYYNKPKDILFENKIDKIFWRGTTTGNMKDKGNRFDLINKWYNKNKNIDIGYSYVCISSKKNLLKNKIIYDKYNKYVKGESSINDFLKYKYILSIRGNDKDSGLNWKLNSNSLILMPKPINYSWLMEKYLIPNYHYVLIKDDFSDLYDKYIWCQNNQDKCIQIINNANKFMEQFKNNKLEEELEEKVINKYFDLIS